MVFGNTGKRILLSRFWPGEEWISKIFLLSSSPLSSPKRSDRKQMVSKSFQEQAESHSKGRRFQGVPIFLMKGRFFQEKPHSCKREIPSLSFLRRGESRFPTRG